jgi:O-antigen/teichoic acid export membrane protein
MTSLIIGIGRTGFVLTQRLVELMAAIILGLVLIPHLGAIGAALGLMGAYAGGAIVATVSAYRLIPKPSSV